MSKLGMKVLTTTTEWLSRKRKLMIQGTIFDWKIMKFKFN